MKKEIIIRIIISSCLCFSAGYIGYKLGTKACKNEAVSENETVSEEAEPWKQYNEWITLIKALMSVDTGNNPKYVNPITGAAGILSLMLSWVAEANQVVGRQEFSLDDRFDIDRSIQIFNVVQGHYNPELDIDKAIKLHDPMREIDKAIGVTLPDAEKEYSNKVKSAMYEIARTYLIDKK